MLVAVDVHYDDRGATTACVGFTAWTDALAELECVARDNTPPAPYEPGDFYKRELPHLIAILTPLVPDIELIIVDAHVWLEPGHEGLGMHVHRALGVPVVGVAKTSYKDGIAVSITRGESKSPLYVSAVGIEGAADLVRSMHGEHRLPTLLKRVDSLARR